MITKNEQYFSLNTSQTQANFLIIVMNQKVFIVWKTIFLECFVKLCFSAFRHHISAVNQNLLPKYMLKIILKNKGGVINEKEKYRRKNF